jgi:hypothetical protein
MTEEIDRTKKKSEDDSYAEQNERANDVVTRSTGQLRPAVNAD